MDDKLHLVTFLKMRFTHRMFGLLIALPWLTLDQITKELALRTLSYAPASVIEGLFSLRLAWNRGVSFSLLGDVNSPWLPYKLSALAFTVSFLILWWMGRSHRPLYTAGLGCILGGAVGNMLDRLQYGAVVDFLDFHVWIEGVRYTWPTFNVADTAIFIGVCCVLVDAVLESREERKKTS